MWTPAYWGSFWTSAYWSGAGAGTGSTPSASVPAGVTVFSVRVPIVVEDES